jgi:hypothetical protein
MKECCIKGCEGRVLARGMCAMHYARMKRNGSPLVGASKQLHGLSPEERFWAYVEKTDGCWVWTGYRDPSGYGRLSIKNIPVLAHRFSYQLHCHEITSDQHLLHTCDNPRCVNPSHLMIGTQADNNKDMFAKGRGRPAVHLGTDHGMSKLTEAQVLEIRASKEPPQVIANRLGVSRRQVRDIINRRSWRHLP